MKKAFLFIPTILLGVIGCSQNNQPSEIQFDYIFTAQPVVFATQSKGFSVYKNVQTDFLEKTDKRIIQASIFVNNNSDKSKVDAFLNSIKNDVESGINDPTLIKAGIEKAGSNEAQASRFGVAAGPAFNVTKNNNGFSLGFEYANEIKDEIKSFVSLINPSIRSIDDELFYVPSELTEVDYSSLKIVCPSGAPAVAFYNYAENENFLAAAPMAQFSTNNYDIIVAPTHGGIKELNNAANYKIAATITFGNMYILSTGKDEDGVMNEGDHVLYFQENDLPGKVFKYLYGDLKLDSYAVSDAAATKNIIENDGVIKL
ncbi:MAG: hypothetical protein J6M95_00295 [Bacilli bacterium]|nr:hypothetical protein [Bacilli bacterium]